MTLTLAREEDLEIIWQCFLEGRAFLKESNVNQWQSSSPNREDFRTDVESQNGYLICEKNQVMGYVAFFFESDERTYDKILGNWKSSETYAFLHRLVLLKKARGKSLGTKVIEKLEKMAREKNHKSLRADTHKDNLPMNNLLKKMGYEFCGTIFVTDGARNAYEKVLG